MKIKNLFVVFFLFYLKLFSQSNQHIAPQNGKYKLINDKGKIIEKGHFKNSQKKGIWYFFDETGMLVKKEKYVAGKLQWQLFFEKGKLTRIIDKHGKITERSKCGC